MIRYLLALLALAVTSSQSQQGHIRIIDFFGTEGMDVEKARSLLPIHIGDEVPADQSPEIEKEIRRALKNALGQEPTDVGIHSGIRPVVILIGLGAANSHFPTIAAPTGMGCLPQEAMRIFDDASKAWGKRARGTVIALARPSPQVASLRLEGKLFGSS